MNTIRYVFETRPNQLNKLIPKYGLSPARDRNDLWKKTNFLVTKFREDFMKDIADIHPDRDLFAWRFSLDNPTEVVKDTELEEIANNTTVSENMSNACGCSGADGEKTSGCCGADGEKTSGCNGDCNCKKKSNITGAEIKEKMKDNMPIVIIASLALVVGVMALTRKA